MNRRVKSIVEKLIGKIKSGGRWELLTSKMKIKERTRRLVYMVNGYGEPNGEAT